MKSAPVATVRVRVTVEVATSSTWGADCTLGQIHGQAVEQARTVVHKALAAESRVRVLEATAVDVVVACTA